MNLDNLKKMGINTTRRDKRRLNIKLSEAQKKEIRRLRDNGMNRTQIADRLDIPYNRVCLWFDE